MLLETEGLRPRKKAFASRQNAPLQAAPRNAAAATSAPRLKPPNPCASIPPLENGPG